MLQFSPEAPDSIAQWQTLEAAAKLLRAVLKRHPLHSGAASALALLVERSGSLEDKLEARYLLRLAAELGCERSQAQVAALARASRW